MYPAIKRICDVFLSLLAIVGLFPLMALLALLIKWDSPGPVLFRQKRMGAGQVPFQIYKFRTMRTDTPADMPTHLLSDAHRHVTRMGAFLRRTSLDELPQLYNILNGDMSFVGPRPALWNQYDLLAERDKYGANDIRPGLTGWAQINGRDELPIPVKARLDGEYVQRKGFWLDTRIFFATLWIAVSGKGLA